MKVLIALACGALIGDAFVHLIPHAFAPHSHEEEESETHESEEHVHENEEKESSNGAYSNEVLTVFLIIGYITFFLIERLFHLFGISHQ